MLKYSIIAPALLFLALSFTVPVSAKDDPTMHQVYLAAEAGKFNEAQAMMDKVLHDHPNSAKAHFVEAELLAKQNLLNRANDELNTAERLEPGLPFAKPEALNNLRKRISPAANGMEQPNIAHQNIPASVKNWLPIALLILGIALCIFLFRLFSQRNARMISANSYTGNVPAHTPYNPSGTGPVMGQPTAGGMGSGLMGSLATGAALGAGVAAGEALIHHFTDGNRNSEQPSSWDRSDNMNENYDMGGNDFGIEDNSSWDDDDNSNAGDDWS